MGTVTIQQMNKSKAWTNLVAREHAYNNICNAHIDEDGHHYPRDKTWDRLKNSRPGTISKPNLQVVLAMCTYPECKNNHQMGAERKRKIDNEKETRLKDVENGAPASKRIRADGPIPHNELNAPINELHQAIPDRFAQDGASYPPQHQHQVSTYQVYFHLSSMFDAN